MSSQSIIKTSHYMGRKHDTWVVERDYNLPYIGGEGEVRGGRGCKYLGEIQKVLQRKAKMFGFAGFDCSIDS